jgi:NAD(P)-dependent dehydrogenase (short-subunit alcohol dehydrogenase family)
MTEKSLFDMTGKVIIVTGSTKGMGRSTAQRLAQHGAKVVISGRTQAECDAVAAAINSDRGKECAIGIASDLLVPDTLEALVDRAVAHFGRLDGLVCNAAVLSFGKEGDVDRDEFSDVLNGNIRNNYILCHRALPHLRAAGGGSIVLIGSQGAGLKPSDSMSVYAIAKRALGQMGENLALYLGAENIRVNTVAPGFIRTEGSQPFWSDPRSLEIGSACTALNRPGEGDEIAGAVLFLLSAAGGYVTGATIPVDGGQLLMGGISNALKADTVFAGSYDRKAG